MLLFKYHPSTPKSSSKTSIICLSAKKQSKKAAYQKYHKTCFFKLNEHSYLHITTALLVSAQRFDRNFLSEKDQKIVLNVSLEMLSRWLLFSAPQKEREGLVFLLENMIISSGKQKIIIFFIPTRYVNLLRHGKAKLFWFICSRYSLLRTILYQNNLLDLWNNCTWKQLIQQLLEILAKACLHFYCDA